MNLTEDVIARFSNYLAEEDENGCIRWTGATSDTGYGCFWLGNGSKKYMGTHRIAYLIANGSIPKGMHILHTCDNRWCVAPAHLRAGTPYENMHDMIRKGRDRHEGFKGEEHPMAKLKEADVIEILRLLESGNLMQKEIAARFSVHLGTIRNIKSGKTWSHLKAA